MSNELITIKPATVTYTTVLAVSRLGGGEHVDCVAIETDAPQASYHIGDKVWVAGLEGFPESRLTMGCVRDIRHTIGSDRGKASPHRHRVRR